MFVSWLCDARCCPLPGFFQEKGSDLYGQKMLKSILQDSDECSNSDTIVSTAQRQCTISNVNNSLISRQLLHVAKLLTSICRVLARKSPASVHVIGRRRSVALLTNFTQRSTTTGRERERVQEISHQSLKSSKRRTSFIPL